MEPNSRFRARPSSVSRFELFGYLSLLLGVAALLVREQFHVDQQTIENGWVILPPIPFIVAAARWRSDVALGILFSFWFVAIFAAAHSVFRIPAVLDGTAESVARLHQFTLASDIIVVAAMTVATLGLAMMYLPDARAWRSSR